MSEVTLQIDGKHYAVACAPGQEDQVVRLARVVEDKLKQLGSNVSASPAQNLVFAALLLADELDEMRSGIASPAVAAPEQDAALQESRRAVEQLKLDLEALRAEHDEALQELATARQTAPQPVEEDSADEFAELAEKLAVRLEAFATRLEDAVDAS